MAASAGCAELGVVTDGTSISYGKPSHGYLIDGVKLPDKGDGYTTREVWAQRGNRYGTDELVDMLKARRQAGCSSKVKDVRLVVADLSSNGRRREQRSIARTRAVATSTSLYYMRDADGKPFEADAMRVFDATRPGDATAAASRSTCRARGCSSSELLTAPEATVQYIFMYEPIAER